MGFTNILHPNRYHGFSARPPFFEGWYYKLISQDEQTRMAIIPGVYIARDPQKNHAFVQVFDSNTAEVRYHRYPFEAFSASRDAFEVSVGENRFSDNEISLSIDDPMGQVSGKLKFNDLVRWPVRLFSPGAMGWFAWVPLMECYHGVVSMDHGIDGRLMLDGQRLDFSGGRGYIEKDWGRQFPSAWIWGQSNHFSRPGTSLMMSVAVIPWVGRSFGGFIIGFLYDGEIHRFTTYHRGRIERLELEENGVMLSVRNRTHRLKIRAARRNGTVLQAPTLEEMDRRIIETLDGELAVEFSTLSGEDIFKGVGRHAGLEIVGDLERLIGMIMGI